MDPTQTGGGKAALIWRFLRPSLLLFTGALTLSMLNTVFNAATPQIIRTTVDSVIGPEPFALPEPLVSLLRLDSLELTRGLILAAAAILAAAVLSGVCNYLSRIWTAKCSENFVKGLRDGLYDHIQKLPFSWHTAHQTGEIIQRCTSDVDVIRNFVTNQLLEVFRTAFMVVFYLVVMFSMNVKISLVALGFLPIIMGYSFFFYTKIAKRFLAADEAEGELSTTVQENLTGVRVVRAFGREQYEIDRFDVKNQRFTDLWIKLGKLMSAYWASGDLITGLQIMTVLLVGVYETVGGGVTAGEFLAFMSYNAAMVWPVRALGRILSEMSKAGVSIDRVKYILDAKEEPGPAEPVEPPMDRDIVFDHVSFGYEEQGRFPLLSPPGPPLPFLAVRAAARAPSCTFWTGSTTFLRAAGASPSAAWTSAAFPGNTCAGTSAWSSRSPSSSHAPSRRTSRPHGPWRAWRRSAPPQPPPAWTPPWRSSPWGTTPWWGSGGSPSPAVRSSAWPSPGC